MHATASAMWGEAGSMVDEEFAALKVQSSASYAVEEHWWSEPSAWKSQEVATTVRLPALELGEAELYWRVMWRR